MNTTSARGSSFTGSAATKVAKAIIAMAAVAAIGHAQAVIVAQDLGIVAPPGTLGAHTMTAFGNDGLPLFTDITSLATPAGGSIGFGSAVNTREIGSGWATWSHGYTGDVYYSNGATSLTLTMPTLTDAFYLYVEPNDFSIFTVTVTANDGTFLSNSADGNAGARGFGFYGTGGTTIASLTVTMSDDFAVGEFGIARQSGGGTIPEPTTLALLGLAGLALGAFRLRRKQVA